MGNEKHSLFLESLIWDLAYCERSWESSSYHSSFAVGRALCFCSHATRCIRAFCHSNSCMFGTDHFVNISMLGSSNTCLGTHSILICLPLDFTCLWVVFVFGALRQNRVGWAHLIFPSQLSLRFPRGRFLACFLLLSQLFQVFWPLRTSRVGIIACILFVA